MKNSRKARPAGGKPYTGHEAVTSQLTQWGALYVLADGNATKIEDRNRDSGRRRYSPGKKRHAAALERFGADAVIWEYRLDLPTHLDVLDHQDAATAWGIVEALAPDALVKLEDARSASPFPAHPHAHFVSARHLPDMPGLWRFPRPLDVENRQASTPTSRTLFGFCCYTAKPTLGGAARPTKEDHERFTADELNRQLLAAQDRTDAARARAQAQGYTTLPITFGWVTGGRKRRKSAA